MKFFAAGGVGIFDLDPDVSFMGTSLVYFQHRQKF